MAATAEWEPPVAPEAAPVAQPERKGTAPAPGPPAAINRKAENNQPDEIHYVNPFVHKLVWDDPIDKAKTALLTVILLPFRVILILVCLVVAWALANIGLYGLSKEDLRTKPLVGWRRQLRHLTALVMRTLFLFGSFNYIRYKGVRASPKEAPVICVAPHTAFYDSVCVVLFGPSAVVAKYETASLPFFGKLIDYAQPIYVCREDPHSRQTTIREIIQRANSKEDWPQILIFPEGTCTNRTSLIKFKPGAFYPGVPIQPVLMRYPNKVDTVTWTWEGPNAIQLLWRTLTQFHTFCEIEFLPVYYPSEAEKANPKLYADNVRIMMAKALDIPISDYTFDDCKLMTFVKNVGMPHPAAIADIGKLRETLKIAATDRESKIVASERQFTDANSLLTYPQFAERMQLDVQQEAAHNLFHKLIRPETPDVIDFREYLLLALFLITLYKPKLIFVESLFHLYGVNGRVNRTQLYQTLQNLVRISQKELNSIFLQADPDNLGTIDYSQFVKAIERNPLLAKLQKNNDPNNLRLG
ncbi:lysophosphatidylcholine acyltransferase-like isoform X1 [Anopheles arabiensis]|uniref:lysophosphatidylcholine acyltransferase-like isoform X1 n=1 Tax=Anopheles arabiensis TaxID=7173 RepID=UPI001AADEC48|nr:lysophosphatidylcholine acyltransferase-like isoform X1 [Anopheles arabiensis]